MLEDVSRPRILLSTTSVFPESTSSAFEVAAKLGYDGVELMVGVDAVASDVDAIKKLSDYHEMQVQSLHAPTLLVTQGTWGTDAWGKLQRSADAVLELGGDVVVVHPPFRWQRAYGEAFVEGIRRLNETSGATFAVENMFPWRTAAGSFQKMYLPSWDPTDHDYDHLTLDLSHASTSRKSSMDYVRAWGDRLKHVHFTDGRGKFKDEHLMPGEGDQDAWAVLRELARRGFGGHIVLEVSTRRCRTRQEREALLAVQLDRIGKEWAKGMPE